MAFLTQYGKIKAEILVFTMAVLVFPTILLASDAVELQTLEAKKLFLEALHRLAGYPSLLPKLPTFSFCLRMKFTSQAKRQDQPI